MSTLQNKHILLGITGSIAAYKSAELCRLLVKRGAQVRVVLTPNAQTFITPMTMQALSGNRVHSELLDVEAEAGMGHIELARWADLIVVAPASANFIARLLHGEADDLLTTLCLARRSTLALAPAMNQAMWNNSNTRKNMQALSESEILVWGPGSGQQACGDEGLGRMLEPAELLDLCAAQFESGLLAGRKVTITAGPTREAIDPVRFISNHSSGKMGYALAQAAAEAGAQVTLVSGPVNLPVPDRVHCIQVESAEQMLAACLASPAEIFIGVAAVADYRPRDPAHHKIKKDEDQMTLHLVRNPDILATIATGPSRPFCVGFAAETENLMANALHKLEHKNLDMIVANDATNTFGNDDASATVYWAGGSKTFDGESKASLTRALIRLIADRLAHA
jgi:phosphopantothenoylcysteine decarboxylase/phosphopantothenate--cysteine ligase